MHGMKQADEKEKEEIREELKELVPSDELHCLPTFRVVKGDPVGRFSGLTGRRART
jgi:hypothetical protein